MSITSFEAAKFACEQSNWSLTSLRLQRILYLATLAYFNSNNTPLISDEFFEPWDFGPILPKLYKKTESFGARPIKNVFNNVSDIDVLSPAAQMIELAVEKLNKLDDEKLSLFVKDQTWARNYLDEMLIIADEDVQKEARMRMG